MHQSTNPTPGTRFLRRRTLRAPAFASSTSNNAEAARREPGGSAPGGPWSRGQKGGNGGLRPQAPGWTRARSDPEPPWNPPPGNPRLPTGSRSQSIPPPAARRCRKFGWGRNPEHPRLREARSPPRPGPLSPPPLPQPPAGASYRYLPPGGFGEYQLSSGFKGGREGPAGVDRGNRIPSSRPDPRCPPPARPPAPLRLCLQNPHTNSPQQKTARPLARRLAGGGAP